MKVDYDGKLEVLDCVVEVKVLEGKFIVYVFFIRYYWFMWNKVLLFVLLLFIRVKYMWFGGYVLDNYC